MSKSKVKAAFFLTFFCLVFNLKAQNPNVVEISIHQDTKFTFMGDDIGNTAFTLDVLVKAEIPVYRFSKNYITFFPSIEYADLKGGVLRRYAFGFGYVIEDAFVRKLNLSFQPNYGFINRLGNTTSSFGFDIRTHYKLTSFFSVSYTHQITERTDLTALYNDTKTIRNSSFIGIIFHL